jgi:hypothetical protein
VKFHEMAMSSLHHIICFFFQFFLFFGSLLFGVTKVLQTVFHQFDLSEFLL